MKRFGSLTRKMKTPPEMREKPERAFEIFFNVQRFAGRIYVRLSDLSRYVRGTYIRMSD